MKGAYRRKEFLIFYFIARAKDSTGNVKMFNWISKDAPPPSPGICDPQREMGIH